MDSVCLCALEYRNVYLVVLCLVMRPRAVHIAKGRILSAVETGSNRAGNYWEHYEGRGGGVNKKLLQFFKPSGNSE